MGVARRLQQATEETQPCVVGRCAALSPGAGLASFGVTGAAGGAGGGGTAVAAGFAGGGTRGLAAGGLGVGRGGGEKPRR